MLPDAIDEAAVQGGVRRESLFYAMFVFWQKFSTGIALALSTLALQVFGDYKTGKCDQPQSVSLTLRLLTSSGPILLVLLSYIFVWRYPITEEKRWEIRQTLEDRRKENVCKLDKNGVVEASLQGSQILDGSENMTPENNANPAHGDDGTKL